MNMIHKFAEEVLDRIYPSDIYCICCGKVIDWSRAYRLCDNCMDNMKWVGRRTCAKCGKILSDSNPDDTCYSCREHAHAYDKGYCCTEYGSNERTIIYSLKYDDRTDIARTIGEIMADRMHVEFRRKELAIKYDMLVPVPITRNKKLLRGYNQADLIAEYFSKHTGIPYDGEVLERTRETRAMKGLTPDERRRNIAGNFALKDTVDVTGLKCLVLDDIYTTGATMDEIARTLKQGGASRVDFLSFASGADVIKS